MKWLSVKSNCKAIELAPCLHNLLQFSATKTDFCHQYFMFGWQITHEIKNFNLKFDGLSFYNHPVKSMGTTYKNLKRFTAGHWDDYIIMVTFRLPLFWKRNTKYFQLIWVSSSDYIQIQEHCNKSSLLEILIEKKVKQCFLF